MKTLQNLKSVDARARRQARSWYTQNSTPSQSLCHAGDGEKGVLKFHSRVVVILLLFFICYTKQLSDVEG